MSVIDDLTQRMDDADQAQQDFSDSLDTSLSDIGNSIDEISQQQSTDEESLGQLTFPLTQDTIDLIREQLFLDVNSVADASVAPGGTATEGTEQILYDGSKVYLWTYVNGAWTGLNFASAVYVLTSAKIVTALTYTPLKGFGAWSTLVNATPPNNSYDGTAASDGIIVATLTGATNGNLNGQTPTGTLRSVVGSSTGLTISLSFTMPIRSGDTWTVYNNCISGTPTLTVYFIPLT